MLITRRSIQRNYKRNHDIIGSGSGSDGGGVVYGRFSVEGVPEPGVSDYNDLVNKPALNGQVLSVASKVKTINGESILGSGNIECKWDGLFAFEIVGVNLYLITDDQKIAKSFSIDSDGNLIYEING